MSIYVDLATTSFSESRSNTDSKELVENFLHALWLCIRPLLCSTSFSESRSNADSNELGEDFWDALWYGIRLILCFRFKYMYMNL